MHQHIFNLVKPNKGNQTEKFSKGQQLRPQHGLQKEELIKLRASSGCSGTFGNASLRDASLCSISCLTGREKQMKVFSCSAGVHSTKEGSVYSSGLPVKGSLNKTTARNNLGLGKQTQIALRTFFTCFVQIHISTREDTIFQIYRLHL